MKAFAIISNQGIVQRIEYAETTPEVTLPYQAIELDGMPVYPSKKSWERLVVQNRALVLEDTRSLSALKLAKREEINTIRNTLELEPVTWNGDTFDADRDSLLRIMGALSMISAGRFTSEIWTLADNTLRTMSSADIVGLMNAISQRTSTLHGIARELKAQVDNATTAEEVASVVWPETTTN